MNRLYVYPYKPASNSAKVLANELGARRIKHKRSRFKGNIKKTVINWGASVLPDEVMKCRVLNYPSAVGYASNKLLSFPILSDAGVSVPEFTLDREVAEGWLEDGIKVMARTMLRANSGRGIVVMTEPDHTVPAALYVKYQKSASEWRVHVVKGKPIACDRKVRDMLHPNPNFDIRSHANGFIFQRNNDEVPHGVISEALAAVAALNLDFGAVDVLWNRKQEQAYVLEVNTAAGMTGQTVGLYTEAFKEIILY